MTTGHSDGNVCTWRAPLVTLRDGRQVPSDSEEWRFECEARRVARMRTRNHRNAYVLQVRQRRGDKVANALENEVAAIWYAEREKRKAEQQLNDWNG